MKLARVFSLAAFTLSALAADYGPAQGALVIVGGAMKDPAIVKRFLDLAGGPEVPLVMIPTAGGAETYDQYWPGARQFREAGATNITVLYTKSRAVADSEEFVRPLQKARGVFFGGGRQWHLADSYLGTRTHRELQAVLERGGVIGGSSAGASIQGSFLARGDTKGSEIMIGDHTEGLGFLRNSAIDQHLLRRNRQFDLLEVIEKYPNLIGIGIDEDTAIVVRGDEFEVIGQSYVAIYDAQQKFKSNARFYLLGRGDHFDLKRRVATRAVQIMKPLQWNESVPTGGRQPSPQ